jgi:RNA polymerase sigma-70 factor (ECF subfamily)
VPVFSSEAAVADDDYSLVRRAQAGEQRAFAELVERYQRKAYGVALGLLKDREEAMDVSQEAFVKVYKYLDHFKGDSSFYTWLYRITVNLCIDRRRRKGANPADQVEFDETVAQEAEGEIGVLGSQLGNNPQKSALRAELMEKIEEALQQIPEKHRAILLLREVEGMSYEDLASTLKIRKGTVMSRLFHARKKMQALLKAYVGDEHGDASGSEEESSGSSQ